MGIHTIHTKSLLIILVRSWFFLSVAVWTQLDFLNKKNKKEKQKKIIIKYSFDNIKCWSIKKLRWYLSQTIWGMSNAGCFFQYYLHGSVGQHRVDIVLISYKHFQRIHIYPVYVVDIAILTTIESALCLHRVPHFLFTSSTLIDIESISCIHPTFFPVS